MKLASYHDGSRDGQLVVVSHDLSTAHYASGIAGRLQQVLDDWNFLSPQLEDLSTSLNNGRARHAFPFDPALCRAPLPRAYQHVQAVASAATAEAHTGAVPLQQRLQQRSGSGLLGPHAARAAEHCAAALAVITGDVAAGASADAALEGVRLLLLTAEFATGAATFTAFAPVAVTPDELGGAWRGGRANLTLDVRCAGRKLKGDAAALPWHFGELIAALGQEAGVAAGSIVGSGAVVSAGALAAGEALRVEVIGSDGASVFGAIDSALAPPASPDQAA